MSKLIKFNAKMNVITKQLMNKIDIIICFDFRLRLIFSIEYDINFNNVCDNEKLNMKKIKTRNYIFVVFYIDYQFTLK